MKLKNGLLLTDALKGIAEYKKATEFLMNRYPYYKYSEYVDRLNSVLGADGYSVSYKVEQPLVYPNEQVMVVVSCRIDIFAEDGTVVLSKNGVGSEEVERNNDTGKYLGLNTCMLFAQQASFKSACKELDIFSCVSKEKGSNGDNVGSPSATGHTTAAGGNNNRGNGNRNGSSTGKKGTVITFYVNKATEVARVDNNTGKNVYKIIGHVCEGERPREAEAEIIFYPNSYGKCEDMMNTYVSKKTPYKVTLEVTPVSGKENSYVFKSFGGK